MDKKQFLSSISCEDNNLISNIFNKIQIAEKTNQIIFTNDFLPPAIWHQILAICENYQITSFANGIFKDADRRMLSFSSDGAPTKYPIDLLEIKNKSKFAKVDHKDYLGAIMSLGIKREKLGDLIIQDSICYAPVCSDISNYIINNLNKIKNCPCTVTQYDYILHGLPERKFEEKVVITTSFRLDGLISAVCNISRNSAVELISSGKILVNYFRCIKKYKIIENNDTLTIRGYGKFKVMDIVGNTQKGRLKVVINKYI